MTAAFVIKEARSTSYLRSWNPATGAITYDKREFGPYYDIELIAMGHAAAGPQRRALHHPPGKELDLSPPRATRLRGLYLAADRAWNASGGGWEALFFANIQGGAFSFVAPPAVSGPDLAVSKAGSVRTLVVPGAMTYTISINNMGTELATGVVVTDQLPANFSLISATSNRGEVCPPATGSGLLACPLQPIGPGVQVDVSVRVAGNENAQGSLQNRAGILLNQGDLAPGNNDTYASVNGITPTPSNTPTPTFTPTPTPTSTLTRIPPTPTPAGQVLNLFWSNDRSRIQAAYPDGSYRREVVPSLPWFTISSLDVHGQNNALYWLDNTNKTIMRAALDGSGRLDIFAAPNPDDISGMNYLTDLKIDDQGNRLYWSGGGGIHAVDATGANRSQVVNLGIYVVCGCGRPGIRCDLLCRRLWHDRQGAAGRIRRQNTCRWAGFMGQRYCCGSGSQPSLLDFVF
jgi:uncharacterized repeat protein (TIGR01451 family)